MLLVVQHSRRLCCWWANNQGDFECACVRVCIQWPNGAQEKAFGCFLAASVSLVHVPPVAQWCSGEKILVAFWHPWGQVPPVAQRFCRGTILLHFSCNCIPEASASSVPIVFKGKHFGCIFCACVCVRSVCVRGATKAEHSLSQCY